MFIAGTLWSFAAHAADGNQLFAFGAVQKSLGGAGAASPQDATWSVINPATLVDLDRRIDGTFELLYVHVTAEPKGSFVLSNPLAGKMDFQFPVTIPTFAGVWPLTEDTKLGFGVIGVAGNRTDFPHSRATLAAITTNGDRRAAEEIARFPLVISHRFDNGWAIGAAVVPAFMLFRTDSFTLKLHTTSGRNHYDPAYGLGLECGVYRNWGKWAIGASYTSPTWMTNLTKYEHDLTPWSMDQPQQVQAGVAYRPIEPVQLILDYKWIGWADLPLMGHQTLQNGLGWKSQNIVKGGVNWDVNDRWIVRGGFSIGNSAVNSSHAFVNAMTPALGRYHFGIGFSHVLTERSTVHLSYSMAIPEERTDNGKGDIFSILGKGTKVSYQEYSLTGEYTYKF